MFFEPFEYESMKKYLTKKVEKLDKSRSRLVKKYGLWWFARMSDEEWAVEREKVV